MLDENKPYPKDVPLLRSLGLPLWTARLHEERFIGEVRPFDNDHPPERQTCIRCFVRCHPAQAWRFEVIRESEDSDYSGMEQVEIRTGSGSFSQFWPMALAVANNMLVVEPPRRLSVQGQ